MAAWDADGSPVAGDLRLSLLLSQLVGSQEVRELLALQLADWHQLQADVFIRDERLRIFCLLAGKPVSGAAGAGFPPGAAAAVAPCSASGLSGPRCGSCPRRGPSTFAPNWTGNAPWASTCGSCFLPRPPSQRPSACTKLPSRLVAAGDDDPTPSESGVCPGKGAVGARKRAWPNDSHLTPSRRARHPIPLIPGHWLGMMGME